MNFRYALGNGQVAVFYIRLIYGNQNLIIAILFVHHTVLNDVGCSIRKLHSCGYHSQCFDARGNSNLKIVSIRTSVRIYNAIQIMLPEAVDDDFKALGNITIGQHIVVPNGLFKHLERFGKNDLLTNVVHRSLKICDILNAVSKHDLFCGVDVYKGVALHRGSITVKGHDVCNDLFTVLILSDSYVLGKNGNTGILHPSVVSVAGKTDCLVVCRALDLLVNEVRCFPKHLYRGVDRNFFIEIKCVSVSISIGKILCIHVVLLYACNLGLSHYCTRLHKRCINDLITVIKDNLCHVTSVEVIYILCSVLCGVACVNVPTVKREALRKCIILIALGEGSIILHLNLSFVHTIYVNICGNGYEIRIHRHVACYFRICIKCLSTSFVCVPTTENISVLGGIFG